MENSDSTSPERALFCREEEDGGRPDIYSIFQGRVTLPAAPRNGFPGGAFPGAADGTGRPWKSDLQGRVTIPPAPEN